MTQFRKFFLEFPRAMLYNNTVMPVCWNGRRGGLKIRWGNTRVGSSPTTGTKSSEHFGSTGEKPSDFKVFGIFYDRKFSKYSMAQWKRDRGSNRVEPLFFHIQAEFQWQRPFSEGCGGEIQDKSKKNLSQSYGRWIVGFDEPMTSAFLRSKRALRLEV